MLLKLDGRNLRHLDGLGGLVWVLVAKMSAAAAAAVLVGVGDEGNGVGELKKKKKKSANASASGRMSADEQRDELLC